MKRSGVTVTPVGPDGWSEFESRCIHNLVPWLNWIEHLTTDEGVEGSNPSGTTMMVKTIKHTFVVQLVECRSPKPMVSGSSPDERAKW